MVTKVGLETRQTRRTAAEITAAITPIILGYEPGNVLRYGAIGDGIADDTTSIQAAIDVVKAAGGGRVLLPFGTYKVTSTLNLVNDEVANIEKIIFIGDWATITSSGFNGLVMQIGKKTATNFRAQHIIIEKIRFEGSGATSTDTLQTAIAIYSSVGIVLRDIQIQNMGGDALVIDKPPLGGNGNAFANNIVLDNVRIRFIGLRCLVAGEAIAIDDLTIQGACMFNNGGSKLTGDGAPDTGAIHIESQNLFWFSGEVSGHGSDDGLWRYQNTVYLQNCSGIWCGTHFETNGKRTSNGAYDILLDNTCHGMVLTGLQFNESKTTDVQFGVRVTAKNCYVGNLHFSGARVPETLVNINSSDSCEIGPIWSSVEPATTRVNLNDNARSAKIFDDGYLVLPRVVGTVAGGNLGEFTWSSGSNHTITNTKVTAASIIILIPKSSSAATLVGGSKSPFVLSRSAGVNFIVETADDSAVAGGEIFSYIMFN